MTVATPMPRTVQLDLLAIGPLAEHVLPSLRAELARTFACSCEIRSGRLDAAFARHDYRGQYNSSEILARMRTMAPPDARCLLGVTELDLFIPILTFVFGEAEVGGRCAVVSTHRLQQSFYGLPADPALERLRLVKEAIHELGHTFGLAHCEDYRCVMAPSHAVEWIDLKGAAFCPDCAAAARNHNRTHAFWG
jgi:archaemetzincin